MKNVVVYTTFFVGQNIISFGVVGNKRLKKSKSIMLMLGAFSRIL